jgi:hypothetical protein
MTLILVSVALALGSTLPAQEQNVRPVITTGSLFEEMVDLAGLASFPDPHFRTVQFSSYDRRSRLPGGPDWFANSDGFGGEPIPNFEKVLKEPDQTGMGEYLIADLDGPGAVKTACFIRKDHPLHEPTKQNRNSGFQNDPIV